MEGSLPCLRLSLAGLVLLSSILASSSVHGEQKFAIEPQDQTTIVGSRVTLPCRVLGKVGKLQWTKDDFGLGQHRHLPGFDRYNMIGSDDEGDYSLEIYPVSLEDDALYQCQVGPGPNGEPGVRSRFARLTVYVPPESPRILQGASLLTTEDREIELECVSLGGKPPAEITWIDGLGNVLKDNIENIVEETPDKRKYNSRSILKLIPKKEHHNTTFICQAQNQAERTYRSAKLRLQVKYAPKVTVSVIDGSTRLMEGMDVRLKCSADANPPDVSYRWFINDRYIETELSTELHLVNVTRTQHDSIVKCEVHNAVGKSEESETLDISYGPRFRKRPHSVQADQGTMITLTCDIDGNPQPDIVWYHEPTDRVVGTSGNLSLVVIPENTGRYYCKASVVGFPEVGAEATVYMKGPPSIVSHKTQFGVPGDNVRMECTAYAVPPPVKVIWSYHGEEIYSDANKEFSVLEDPLSEGIKSTMIIRDSKQDHFGVYNCTVVNAYGADVLEITLKPQKTFPLLLILSGILGGIIIIIIIIMIIILCQRKVKKPPVNPGFTSADHHGSGGDPEKQCKDSDRSSNISDIKLELRTGSSVSNVHCELDYGLAGGTGGGSETGSESVVTRVGVPLAGPVPIDHRYSNRYSSGDYPEPVFPPKNDGQNNNGYVPYVDYSRDYQPPPLPVHHQVVSSCSPLTTPVATSLPASVSSSCTLAGGMATAATSPGSATSGGGGGHLVVDPRYSAAYGNPYLRGVGSGSSLPPPPPLTPAPPPYSARNGVLPNRGPIHYITTQQPANGKRASLATHV